MSNSRRNAKYANAGIVVTVSVQDFEREGFSGPLAGLEFQRHWEAKAYELGGGKFFAPAQTIPDYLAGRVKKDPGGTSYRPGLAHTDLNKLFPERLTAVAEAGAQGVRPEDARLHQRRRQAHRHREPHQLAGADYPRRRHAVRVHARALPRGRGLRLRGRYRLLGH